jgi:hypothetical protein
MNINIHESRGRVRNLLIHAEATRKEYERAKETAERVQAEHLALCKEAGCCPLCTRVKEGCLCVVMAGEREAGR